MFAIVETSGRQYRVEEGDTIIVDRMADYDVGDTVTMDDVLMVSGDELKIGQPTVDGAKVTAKVTSHHKGDKVTTYKYRRRQRTRRRVGFRASLTALEISRIEA